MKSAFFIPTDSGPAVAEVSGYYGGRDDRRIGYMIGSIGVPFAERGNGLGQKLLDQVIAAADEAGEVLFLEVIPFDEDTDYPRLKDWYARHGFVDWYGISRRPVRGVPEPRKQRVAPG